MNLILSNELDVSAKATFRNAQCYELSYFAQLEYILSWSKAQRLLSLRTLAVAQGMNLRAKHEN